MMKLVVLVLIGLVGSTALAGCSWLTAAHPLDGLAGFAISPDGELVLAVNERDGDQYTGRLLRVDINTEEVEVVHEIKGSWLRNPRFAPDGSLSVVATTYDVRGGGISNIQSTVLSFADVGEAPVESVPWGPQIWMAQRASIGLFLLKAPEENRWQPGSDYVPARLQLTHHDTGTVFETGPLHTPASLAWSDATRELYVSALLQGGERDLGFSWWRIASPWREADELRFKGLNDVILQDACAHENGFVARELVFSEEGEVARVFSFDAESEEIVTVAEFSSLGRTPCLVPGTDELVYMLSSSPGHEKSIVVRDLGTGIERHIFHHDRG